MRQRDVVGRHPRRRKRTTIADPAAPPAPDLIRRDFTATAPDQWWCGDISYLRVDGGCLYLATVIDIATRRLIGWSINTHMLLERQRIATLRRQGLTIRAITERLGRAPSTVSWELRRNVRSHDQGVYDADLADARVRQRPGVPRPRRRSTRRCPGAA